LFRELPLPEPVEVLLEGYAGIWERGIERRFGDADMMDASCVGMLELMKAVSVEMVGRCREYGDGREPRRKWIEKAAEKKDREQPAQSARAKCRYELA
jgi:hypothetical protein